MLDLKQHTHRRLNPLTRDWILVSPHRNQRPWQGQIERPELAEIPPYDSSCYMCPCNTRVGGERNPDYRATFVFPNDFPALKSDTPFEIVNANSLVVAQGERGICRVICFSPRHDLTLARMTMSDIRKVIDVWINQYQDLAHLDFIRWVQIFENRGAMMGASNPHPHCQIWASSSVPNEPAKEQVSQYAYYATHGTPLLIDYLKVEKNREERLICSNDHFTALVPFWATWPFETLVLCDRSVTELNELTNDERDGLADILKRLTTRYDNLFETSFPYSMGFHQKPTDGLPHPECQLHLHFYPPLLRSASVKKFMVGYEMLATSQRDITAEDAAEKLRNVSAHHYLEAQRQPTY